jgi:hypothetical protein
LLEIVPEAALKVAVTDAAATVTDAGTVSAVALLDRVTLAAPLGAGCVRVTVQAVEELVPTVTGLQMREETCAAMGAVRPMLAMAEVLL